MKETGILEEREEIKKGKKKEKERGRYQQFRRWRRKRSWGRGGDRRRCSVRECGEAG